MPPPGTYDPLPSDFDRNLQQIHRRKRLQRRSSWAPEIPFVLREPRIRRRLMEDPGPAPIAQFPTDLGFQAAKMRASKSGLLGRGPDRFPQPKQRKVKLEPKDLFELGSPLPRREAVPKPQRPRYTHIFANPEERFKEKQKPTPGYLKACLIRCTIHISLVLDIISCLLCGNLKGELCRWPPHRHPSSQGSSRTPLCQALEITMFLRS